MKSATTFAATVLGAMAQLKTETELYTGIPEVSFWLTYWVSFENLHISTHLGHKTLEEYREINQKIFIYPGHDFIEEPYDFDSSPWYDSIEFHAWSSEEIEAKVYCGIPGTLSRS